MKQEFQEIGETVEFSGLETKSNLQEPPPAPIKKVKDNPYFNVILIVGKMVESNNLFTNLEQAESKMIDTIQEYSFNILLEGEIEKYLKDKYAILEKVSVFLDKPIIN